MATVKFVTGTLSKYNALAAKDAGTLYFVTDAGRIYKGDKDVSSDVFYVEAVPTSLQANKIAVVKVTANGKTMHDVYVGDANNAAVKVLPGSVSDKEAFDNATVFGSYVPTVSAVKGYVEDATADAIDKANRAFVDASYSDGVMSFTPANGSAAKTVDLTGVAHDLTWDPDTFELVVKNYGSEDIKIDIPKDFFLQNGEYVAEHVFNEGEADEYTGPAIHLTVNISNGDEGTKKEIFIPVKELVDVYTVESTDTVTLAMDEQHNITANVKIAAGTSGLMIKTDNGIEATDKSLADISAEIDADVEAARAAIEAKLVGDGDANKVVVSTETGVTRSSAAIGGAALEETASANVLATEKAVKDALDAAIAAEAATREDADTAITAAYKAADEALHTTVKQEIETAVTAAVTWDEL